MKLGGSSYGDILSISINGTEYTTLQYGLNLVVYDTVTDCVIDAVGLDVYSTTLSLQR